MSETSETFDPAIQQSADVAPGTATTLAPDAAEPDPRRWWSLVVIALSQLMIVLDITVVTIALPSAQAALHIAPGRQAVGDDRLHPLLRRAAAARR